jgi:L-alanine-DL-glutamate epimerase-like enolase superfamily enzyme
MILHLDEGVGEWLRYSIMAIRKPATYLEGAGDKLGDDPYLIDDAWNADRLKQAARAGIDIALHDLWGKRLGQPLFRLLGLDPKRIPQTSFTIAMDEPDEMARRTRESGYPIIKVKLGGTNDEAIVSAIRQASTARLRVDANAGWSREQAAVLIPRLVQYDLEFIEQPLETGYRWTALAASGCMPGVKVPIFVDENVKTARCGSACEDCGWGGHQAYEDRRYS